MCVCVWALLFLQRHLGTEKGSQLLKRWRDSHSRIWSSVTKCWCFCTTTAGDVWWIWCVYIFVWMYSNHMERWRDFKVIFLLIQCECGSNGNCECSKCLLCIYRLKLLPPSWTCGKLFDNFQGQSMFVVVGWFRWLFFGVCVNYFYL